MRYPVGRAADVPNAGIRMVETHADRYYIRLSARVLSGISHMSIQLTKNVLLEFIYYMT